MPGVFRGHWIACPYPREVFSLWIAIQAMSLLIFLGYRVYLLYYSSRLFHRETLILKFLCAVGYFYQFLPFLADSEWSSVSLLPYLITIIFVEAQMAVFLSIAISGVLFQQLMGHKELHFDLSSMHIYSRYIPLPIIL